VAQSPAHKFGQIIGDTLENMVKPILADFSSKHNLYLDTKGNRPARRGTKVSWYDDAGNKHDLDFVLERGGNETQRGTPVAFIEVAWRRYTQHSRNKVQEIQGAIIPLTATYRAVVPFTGAILAGEFTDGALSQLRSLGFAVLYLPYQSVVAAFSQIGVDARSDESMPEIEYDRKIDALKSLHEGNRRDLATVLFDDNRVRLDEFIESLTRSITRKIEHVQIVILHGPVFELKTIEEAILLIELSDESTN